MVGKHHSNLTIGQVIPMKSLYVTIRVYQLLIRNIKLTIELHSDTKYITSNPKFDKSVQNCSWIKFAINFVRLIK